MGHLTRMCPHCGFQVHAIADTEEEGVEFTRKLWDDNKRHKASCWFERLSLEQQNEIELKAIIEDAENYGEKP